MARNVANLFGVVAPDADYDWTWVSDLSRLTLTEVAQGCPSPERAAGPAVRSRRRVPRERRDGDPAGGGGAVVGRAISPTSFTGFGPNTLAAAVLSGCNELYEDVTTAICDSLIGLGLAPESGDKSVAVPPKARLEVAAALIIEAYCAAPALFLAGAAARHIQSGLKPMPSIHRALPDASEGLARCEIGSSDGAGEVSNRDRDDDDDREKSARSPFKLRIVDGVIEALKLEPSGQFREGQWTEPNAAPHSDQLAAALSTDLIRTIQRIGSPEGRGALRIRALAGAPRRHVMEAFVPTLMIARSFAHARGLWLAGGDGDGALSSDQDPRKSRGEIVAAVLGIQWHLLFRDRGGDRITNDAAALGLLWMARFCHAPQADDLATSEFEAVVEKVERLRDHVNANSSGFSDGVRARVGVGAAWLALVLARRKFRPAGSAEGVTAAIAALAEAMAAPNLRDLVGEGVYMEMLFDASEALNGVRRDLIEPMPDGQRKLRKDLTAMIASYWDVFFEIAEGWDPEAIAELNIAREGRTAGRRPIHGKREFRHRMHNFASFRARDVDDPDSLMVATDLFRNIILPAREYVPGEPESAASEVPRPHLLQYSLEVAASAEVALARLYSAAGFKRKAQECAANALEYARALSGMPAVLMSVRRTRKVPDYVPSYDEATTAANIADAYMLSDELMTPVETGTSDAAHREAAIGVARTWLEKDGEATGTALARRVEALTNGSPKPRSMERE